MFGFATEHNFLNLFVFYKPKSKFELRIFGCDGSYKVLYILVNWKDRCKPCGLDRKLNRREGIASHSGVTRNDEMYSAI